MPQVPLWFTAEVMSRLRGGKQVPGSLQHYACCPVPAHNDQHASMGIRPGDDVMIVYNCKAGCDPVEIRNALADRGIPDEYLGIYGTPGYEARRRARGTSEERRQVERLRAEMAELKATLRGLLSADNTLAMLKIRIWAVAEGVEIPTHTKKAYVEFAKRAGVSQPRAYAAWDRDPLVQLQDPCVSEDYVVLAQPEDESQAAQASEPAAILETRKPFSKREGPDSRIEKGSTSKDSRFENDQHKEAVEALRAGGLAPTKPAA